MCLHHFPANRPRTLKHTKLVYRAFLVYLPMSIIIFSGIPEDNYYLVNPFKFLMLIGLIFGATNLKLCTVNKIKLRIYWSRCIYVVP